MKLLISTLILLQVLLIGYYTIKFVDTHDTYYLGWIIFNAAFLCLNIFNLKNEIENE